MFINEKVFKSLAKKAWQDGDLYIEKTDTYYTIAANYWDIQVRRGYLTNKIKSILVEMIGELPEDGEAFIYSKKEDPEEQADRYGITREMYRKADQNYERTNITINSNGVTQAVMQETKTHEKILINAVFTALVDTTKVDDENGETFPENPVGYEDGMGLMWENNIMTLQCGRRKPRYTKERNLLNTIGNMDIRWIGTKEEEILEED